jgi:hypothetical protein
VEVVLLGLVPLVKQEVMEILLHFLELHQREEEEQILFQEMLMMEDQVVEVLLTQGQVVQVIHHLQIPLKETLVEIL